MDTEISADETKGDSQMGLFYRPESRVNGSMDWRQMRLTNIVGC